MLTAVSHNSNPIIYKREIKFAKNLNDVWNQNVYVSKVCNTGYKYYRKFMLTGAV